MLNLQIKFEDVAFILLFWLLFLKLCSHVIHFDIRLLNKTYLVFHCRFDLQ